MKKMTAFFVAIMLLLGISSSALAAGKLNVEQENAHNIVSTYSNYEYVFAKVANVGDKPIKVNAYVLEVYDADGEVITSTDYGDANACFLQPGEYTYLYMYEDIEEGMGAPADHSLTVTGKTDNDYINLRFPVTTDLQLNVEDGWWMHNYMYATVTNNTDQPVYSIQVVMALLDAQGNILYVVDDNLYSEKALAPGSSIVFRKDIPGNYIEYFNANNLIPVAVDAIGFAEVATE